MPAVLVGRCIATSLAPKLSLHSLSWTGSALSSGRCWVPIHAARSPLIPLQQTCYHEHEVRVFATWRKLAMSGREMSTVSGICFLLMIACGPESGGTGTASSTQGDGCQTLDLTTSDQITSLWLEDAQLACGSCESIPFSGYHELRFDEDGTFAYAWTPFEEGFWNIWGRYQWDPQTGVIEFFAEGGNSEVPPDFDGTGQVRHLADGRLRIEGVWFGNGSESCGYEFCTLQNCKY